MSYISAVRQGDNVVVWERHDNSVEGRITKTYPAPYYFYVKDPDGEFISMYGDKLSRFDFDNARQFYHAKKMHDERKIKMYESDIASELRVLSHHYYEAEAPDLNVTFFDIEVDYVPELGFSSIENPYAPVNSVAMYHQHEKRLVVLAVPPQDANCEIPDYGPATQEFIDELNERDSIIEGVEIDIYFCKDERDLLIRFLGEIENSDVISGWNSDYFDVPYIGTRLKKLGTRYFNMLSFPNSKDPSWRPVFRYGQPAWMLDLGGRVSLDYLDLFRKYEEAERPSYKLESIADEIVPELPKLNYEGSLALLYRNDFTYFVRYNIRDTEILKGFEDRLGYVGVANDVVHLSTGLFKHVGGTLKLAELATINHCHHKLDPPVVVNDMDVPEMDSQIQGALVLSPQVGEHDLVGMIDIKSLYPNAIRMINISPETLRGQFIAETHAAKEIADDSDKVLSFRYEDGTTEERSASEWREVFKENGWAISGFGTAFDQTKEGIIPMILGYWFNMRVDFQKKKAEAKAAGNEESAAYYNRLQYVYKIKLNSFYGALTNKYFRFYDLRLGESTTGTGRAILRHQCAEVNRILKGEYDIAGEAVVYGDTDSTYFQTYMKNNVDAVDMAVGIGDMVNDSFNKFLTNTFLISDKFHDIISTECELVTGRGIYVSKKRYILHVIWLDGYFVDKIKVMGLDTKKTTLPKEVSKELNMFIERYLKGGDWDEIAKDIVQYKEVLSSPDNIMGIGLPKGIKGIEDYTNKLKGDPTHFLPGHVAAAIMYNLCLEKYEDNISPKIISGNKIKVFYFNQKFGRFKSIAIPVDIEIVPQWFFDEYADKIDTGAQIKRLVDNPIKNIITAIGKDVPTKQSLYVDSELIF